jgi:hypothetical protein
MSALELGITGRKTRRESRRHPTRPILIDTEETRHQLGDISRRHLYELRKKYKLRVAGSECKQFFFFDEIEELANSLVIDQGDREGDGEAGLHPALASSAMADASWVLPA